MRACYRARVLRRELKEGGLWGDIRDEYLAWERNHTARGDAALFACQEFAWQRTLSFRLLGKVGFYFFKALALVNLHSTGLFRSRSQPLYLNSVLACISLL